jgi:hypothetical protein
VLFAAGETGVAGHPAVSITTEGPIVSCTHDCTAQYRQYTPASICVCLVVHCTSSAPGVGFTCIDTISLGFVLGLVCLLVLDCRRWASHVQ